MKNNVKAIVHFCELAMNFVQNDADQTVLAVGSEI